MMENMKQEQDIHIEDVVIQNSSSEYAFFNEVDTADNYDIAEIESESMLSSDDNESLASDISREFYKTQYSEIRGENEKLKKQVFKLTQLNKKLKRENRKLRSLNLTYQMSQERAKTNTKTSISIQNRQKTVNIELPSTNESNLVPTSQVLLDGSVRFSTEFDLSEDQKKFLDAIFLSKEYDSKYVNELLNIVFTHEELKNGSLTPTATLGTSNEGNVVVRKPLDRKKLFFIKNMFHDRIVRGNGAEKENVIRFKKLNTFINNKVKSARRAKKYVKYD